MKNTQRYFLFEKNTNDNTSETYTYEDLKSFFKPSIPEDEMDDYDAEMLKEWESIDNILSLEFYIEDYVNNSQGIHYHDFYIKEA